MVPFLPSGEGHRSASRRHGRQGEEEEEEGASTGAGEEGQLEVPLLPL